MSQAANLPARAEDRAAWLHLWSYFGGKSGALALVCVLGAAQSAAYLPTLALVRYAFDAAIPQGKVGLLVWLGLALVGVRLVASILSLATRALSLKLTKTAISDMRRDLVGALYALPRDFFGLNDAARVQTRIVQETERLDNLTGAILSAVLPAALTSALLAGVLIYLNWWLVLLLAGLLPLVWFATLMGGRQVKREVQAFQKDFEGFSRGVQFVLRQMDLTRLRGFEAEELERQTDGLRRLERSGIRMAMSFAVHGQVQAMLTGLGGLVLLIAGGVAVAQGAMSMGSLIAFYLAAGVLNGNLSRVTGAIPDMIAGQESLKKLVQLRAEAPASPYGGDRPVAFEGRISLRSAAFGYRGEALLKDVTLDLEPGTTLAIVGSNGAGKSTIVNLILGFYRPDGGELLVEGVPYEVADLRAVRRAIGVVPQRPTFFPGTVAENIAYGWPQVGRDEVAAAARRACAEAFILALPDGYDTQIGEGGMLLSGGEAQRLAIARALIGKPKLLILDEPTNHLDTDAIGQIMGRLTAGADRPGVMMISHDAAVIGLAETVLRLEGGTLKPLGTAAANQVA